MWSSASPNDLSGPMAASFAKAVISEPEKPSKISQQSHMRSREKKKTNHRLVPPVSGYHFPPSCVFDGQVVSSVAWLLFHPLAMGYIAFSQIFV